MTSSADTTGHPDVVEISDLTEGILPPDRDAEVRRHLDACEPCADVLASLEEIRELLGTFEDAPTMPVDIVGRLDTALAAEALSAPAVSAQNRGPVSRETSITTDRPAGRSPAATGPGRKDPRRGRRRRTVVLGSLLTAAVLGTGSLILQSLGSGGSGTTAHGTVAPSSASFSGNSVQSQVKDLLTAGRTRRHHSVEPRSGVETEQINPESTQSANTLLQTQPPVPDCVREAINSRDDVLGSKTGVYAGKSAYLVVVPDADDNTRVTAYVVASECVHQHPDSVGKVLMKQSFPRA
ncbi:anti-sigma factor family protein [Streptomyces cellostaticus]|uniref:anti-sigma factor family protein n=1 Tax=Streptomyces cellostaticus TaxID=67285 RepID=UPI002026C68D|nr:zf-HC2 domain-containing protein [Streptomyces cellostaticus]